MSYKIKIKKQKDYMLLKLIGAINASSIHAIAQKLESLTTGKYPTVVIDLSETNYIDSHGLGVFVYAWKTMEKNHKSMVFLNPQDFMHDLFEETNLDQLFRVIETIEEL